MLLVLMLVFDRAGIHNDPELQILLFRTEIGELLICRRRGHDLCILADWPSPRQTTGR